MQTQAWNRSGGAGEIDRKALQNLRRLMLSGIEENPDLDNFLAAFLSRFRLANDPMPPPALLHQKNCLINFSSGAGLLRNPWTRLTWIESAQGARLYAAGQPYDCSVRAGRDAVRKRASQLY